MYGGGDPENVVLMMEIVNTGPIRSETGMFLYHKYLSGNKDSIN